MPMTQAKKERADNLRNTAERDVCLMCGEWRGDQVVHSCKPKRRKLPESV